MVLLYSEQFFIISINFMKSCILCKLCLFSLQMVHIGPLDALPVREVELQGHDVQNTGCCQTIKDVCTETSLERWFLVTRVFATLCNL